MSQYSHPKLMPTLDHPVDDQTVVVRARVALAAKIKVVQTVRTRIAKSAEPDHPPRAITAWWDGTTSATITGQIRIVEMSANHLKR